MGGAAEYLKCYICVCVRKKGDLGPRGAERVVLTAGHAQRQTESSVGVQGPLGQLQRPPPHQCCGRRDSPSLSFHLCLVTSSGRVTVCFLACKCAARLQQGDVSGPE